MVRSAPLPLSFGCDMTALSSEKIGQEGNRLENALSVAAAWRMLPSPARKRMALLAQANGSGASALKERGAVDHHGELLTEVGHDDALGVAGADDDAIGADAVEGDAGIAHHDRRESEIAGGSS